MRKTLTLVTLGLFIWACASQSQEDDPNANPPLEGFNQEGSDAAAIAIADEVMLAMGGRQAWDNTRHITWNFFGARTLYWDKYTGDVRIERPNQGAVTLLNINTREGRAMLNDGEVTDTDSLKNLINAGYSAWVNDSYWLVMPFKLKDSGLTLNYLGSDTTQLGAPADVLQLTFDGVGVTPQNKYHVWVDKNSRLVVQWAYFAQAIDEEPRIISPWTDYKQHGRILLSGGRGERNLSDIAVYETLPESIYKSFERD